MSAEPFVTFVPRVDVDELAARRQATGRHVRTRHGLTVSCPAQPQDVSSPRADRATEERRGGASEAAQRPRLGNAVLSSPTPGQTVCVPPPLAPDEADVRWAVHRAMWHASPLKKVRSCRRYAHDPDAESVPLRFSPNSDGGVSVGVGGLKTCNYWHSCLICGAKISVGRARELEHLFKIWAALGGSVVLATFSCRHHKGQSLEHLVAGQRAAWEAVTSDRPWKQDLAALGVARFDVPDSDRHVRGIVPAFETTVGDEFAWHPHKHVYFLVLGEITKEQARAALQPAWDRWCAGLAELGLTAVAEAFNPQTGQMESAGFDVQVMNSADAEKMAEAPQAQAEKMARYPFKLALEAVGGVFKRGREVDADGNVVGKRHRTPFEVMEHYAAAVAQGQADDELAQADLAIIREWSQTAADMRFRQCPWPPGLRAVFTELARELGIEGPLLEKEQTDEELAEAEEDATETAGEIGRRDWEETVAFELDTLRAAGRDAGLTGVVEWFDRRGLRFDLSATGVHRVVHELQHPPPRMVVSTTRRQ